MATKLFRDWKINHILAVGSATRAQTGFHFLETILDRKYFLRQEAVSPPYSRQVNILISHNVEMLFDSAVLISSKKSTEQELINELKVNHNLKRLWDNITDCSYRKLLGVQDVIPKSQNIFKYYDVRLDDGFNLNVHDLKNIRYDINDFRDKESENLRRLQDESINMDGAVSAFTAASKRILDILYGIYDQK